MKSCGKILNVKFTNLKSTESGTGVLFTSSDLSAVLSLALDKALSEGAVKRMFVLL